MLERTYHPSHAAEVRPVASWAGFVYRVVGGHFGNNLSLEQIMGFPTPKVFVTADSVIKGKPDPEGKRVLSYPKLS